MHLDTRRFTLSLLPALICATSLAAAAQGGGPRTPPPEAFTACEAKKAADACSVALRDRAISGVCTADAASKLFCRPERPPHGEHRGPPPEAFAACAGKADSAACTVTTPDGSARGGTCKTGPDDKVACAPEGMGPPPHAE